jgi:hypothetical protein
MANGTKVLSMAFGVGLVNGLQRLFRRWETRLLPGVFSTRREIQTSDDLLLTVVENNVFAAVQFRKLLGSFLG